MITPVQEVGSARSRPRAPRRGCRHDGSSLRCPSEDSLHPRPEHPSVHGKPDRGARCLSFLVARRRPLDPADSAVELSSSVPSSTGTEAYPRDAEDGKREAKRRRLSIQRANPLAAGQSQRRPRPAPAAPGGRWRAGISVGSLAGRLYSAELDPCCACEPPRTGAIPIAASVAVNARTEVDGDREHLRPRARVQLYGRLIFPCRQIRRGACELKRSPPPHLHGNGINPASLETAQGAQRPSAGPRATTPQAGRRGLDCQSPGKPRRHQELRRAAGVAAAGRRRRRGL